MNSWTLLLRVIAADNLSTESWEGTHSDPSHKNAMICGELEKEQCLWVLYDKPLNMKSPVNIIAVIGLALGAIFGLVGTVVTQANLRTASWAIDSVGLIVATALLSLKFFRKGNDYVAAGFLIFTIGESVMLSGTAATLVGSVPAFAAGTALWSAALLLTSVPKEFPGWVR